MISRLKEKALRVELITNGLLVSELMACELIRLKLDKIWFSVDRLHTEEFGNLTALLPNLERLNYLRFLENSPLPEGGVVFVATRSNIGELPDILRGASRYGVSHFMVTNVLPYTREMCGEMLYTRALDGVGSQPSPWSPLVQLPRMDWNEHTFTPLYQTLRARHNVQIIGTNSTDAESQLVQYTWDLGNDTFDAPATLREKWAYSSDAHITNGVLTFDFLSGSYDTGHYCFTHDRFARVRGLRAETRIRVSSTDVEALFGFRADDESNSHWNQWFYGLHNPPAG